MNQILHYNTPLRIDATSIYIDHKEIRNHICHEPKNYNYYHDLRDQVCNFVTYSDFIQGHLKSVTGREWVFIHCQEWVAHHKNYILEREDDYVKIKFQFYMYIDSREYMLDINIFATPLKYTDVKDWDNFLQTCNLSDEIDPKDFGL